MIGKSLFLIALRRVQQSFVDDERYNDFVNEVLQLSIFMHPKIKEFISKLKFTLYLKTPKSIDQEVMYILIQERLLIWDMEIYKELNSPHYKNLFAIENIKENEDDLLILIQDKELEWSIELAQELSDNEILEEEEIGNYVKNNILEVNFQEFLSIIDREIIGYDEELLKDLLNKTEKLELLFEYLVHLEENSYTEKVASVIDDYEISWDKRLFSTLREKDIDAASKYLLGHIANIDEVNIDQKMLDSLIVESDNTDISMTLIKKYEKKLEISPLIAEEVFSYLDQDADTIFANLSENLVVKLVNSLALEDAAKFLKFYLKHQNYNREKVFELMLNLQHPLDKIQLKAGQLIIDGSHEYIEILLDYLKEHKVISTYKYIKDRDEFEVNRKQV